MAYDNSYKQGGNNYQGKSNWKKGGGSKDFKADPINAYLKNRCVAMAYAKDMIVAKVIGLADLRDWTDKLTVLLYGAIKTDPKVDAELIRLTSRLKAQTQATKDPQPEVKPEAALCPTCEYGPEGTNECQAGSTGEVFTECAEHKEMETK